MKIKFTASYLPLSPLIMLWTWSKCSHCEFEFSDGMTIVPAMEAGKVIATKNRTYIGVTYLKMRDYTYDLPITERQEQEIRVWSEEQIGKPYDYTALAPLNVLIPRKKKAWKDDSRWTCSEFCAAGLELIGMEFFPDNFKKITPGDLMKKFEKENILAKTKKYKELTQ